eukprot:364730-Chlamydomonas_euryale.AAC.9
MSTLSARSAGARHVPVEHDVHSKGPDLGLRALPVVQHAQKYFSRPTCLDSVADLQLPADPLWRKLALADRNERARHVANHLVQETAATELHANTP